MASPLEVLQIAREETGDEWWAYLAAHEHELGRPEAFNLPEAKALEEAFGQAMEAVAKAEAQVRVSIKVTAPTREAGLHIVGWTQPALYKTRIDVRDKAGHVEVHVQGWLRNHPLTEGWTGPDL